MKKYIIIAIVLSGCASRALVDITTVYRGHAALYRLVDITQSSRIGAGFFAELGAVLNDLIYYEQDGIHAMRVDWTSPFFPFKDGHHENGWDLYFDPIAIETSTPCDEPIYHVGNALVHELHDQLCIAPWLLYDEYLPYRLFAYATIKKYIHIKPEIMEQVELFYNRSMRHHACIGVHVRFAEIHERETPAGHPSFYEYWVEIDSLLQKYADRQVTIFLATDSNAVITDFKKRYGKRLIYIDTYRAQQREDPSLIYESPSYWMSHVAEWHKKKPGYRGGVGALMDCLLLSKCDYLIHTTSNVATFASFFNPYIKSIYVPREVPFSHCRFKGDSTIRNQYLNPI